MSVLNNTADVARAAFSRASAAAKREDANAVAFNFAFNKAERHL